MLIKVAICDEDEVSRTILKNIVSEYYSTKNILFEVWTYSSGQKLLNEYSKKRFSFILLDIDLKSKSGIYIAKKIREEHIIPIQIVFITRLSQYKGQVLSLHIFDYILKPFRNQEIKHVLDELMFWHNGSDENRNIKLHFKTIYGNISISPNDLYYFEYTQRRICINTKYGKFYMYDKIKQLSEDLAEYNFVMSHAAFLVNLNEIRQYNKSSKYLIMNNGNIIPIAQLKSKDFRDKYLEYLNKIN